MVYLVSILNISLLFDESVDHSLSIFPTYDSLFFIAAGVVHLADRGGVGGNAQDVGSLIMIISMVLSLDLLLHLLLVT
jgi:hypothetical protein